MGILLDIQLALDSHLDNLSPAVSTSWPNVKFKPSEDTSYMRPTLLPATSLSSSLAGAMYHQGIYQVDVFVPLEKGVSALLDIQDNIYTLFKTDVITKGLAEVHIEAISRGPTNREEAWYHGIIEIQFRCFDA